MRIFKLKTNITPNKDMQGVFSFVIKDNLKDLLGFDLDDHYKRTGLCLKVFKDPVADKLEDFAWGYKTDDKRLHGKAGPNTTLFDCTVIQNLCHFEGFAPRVYDIVLLESPSRNYYAQVTDFIEGDKGSGKDDSKIKEFRKKYGNIYLQNDPNENNWVDGKLVDFQVMRFTNKHEYEKRLSEMANTQTDWGSKSGISYESVEELGVTGQRDTSARAKVLGMDEFDFNGKTVLDIGCSTGSFCRLANRYGAARVFGMDLGKEVKAAREISNYLGCWNIDFIEHKFKKDSLEDYEFIKNATGFEFFDVVLFLSVHAQIGYPTKYMSNLCKEICFIESHSGHHEHTFRPLMEKDFREVIFKGRQRNNARPAMIGIK